MSVKIRLRRTGRKKNPNYRLVVANSTTPRGGEYLDSVGTYNPLVKPAELRIDLAKVDKWLAQGAEMSDTAASLIGKARRGGDDKVTIRGVGPDVKAESAGDVTAAAEPQRAAPVRTSAPPSRPGSRGKAAEAPAAAAAPAAEAPAAAAEAPAAEAPAAAAEAPAAEAPAAEAPAAEAAAEPAGDSTEQA